MAVLAAARSKASALAGGRCGSGRRAGVVRARAASDKPGPAPLSDELRLGEDDFRLGEQFDVARQDELADFDDAAAAASMAEASAPAKAPWAGVAPPPAAPQAGGGARIEAAREAQREDKQEEGFDFKEAIDNVLMYDFFFVLFALAWFVVGVLLRTDEEHPGPVLGVWVALWPVVIQPAITVLMTGALVNGAVGWVRENTGGD